MVHYIDTVNGNKLVKFNKENESVTILKNINSYIEYVWVADEEGVFDGVQINVGDIIIRMYDCTNSISDNKKILVIKDNVLKEHYRRAIEYLNKINLKKPCGDCELDCTCCSDSNC